MRTLLALTSGAGYGVYLFLINISAKTGIPSSIGAMTLQVTAAVGGIIIVLLSPNKPSFQQVPLNGLFLALGAGVAVQLAELFSFMAYERGLSVTVGPLLIVGLQVLVPVILGIVISKESLQPIQLVAFGLIAIGVGLLSVVK